MENIERRDKLPQFRQEKTIPAGIRYNFEMIRDRDTPPPLPLRCNASREYRRVRARARTSDITKFVRHEYSIADKSQRNAARTAARFLRAVLIGRPNLSDQKHEVLDA